MATVSTASTLSDRSAISVHRAARFERGESGSSSFLRRFCVLAGAGSSSSTVDGMIMGGIEYIWSQLMRAS